MARNRNPAERLRCAWCGADWWSGAELDVVDTAIACMRGRGCARRPDSDCRETRRSTTGSGWRREYLLDGHWYSVQQIGDLAGVGRMTVGGRLRAGWTVRDAITVPLSKSLGGRSRDARFARLLAFARRAHKPRQKRIPSLIAVAARTCGISYASMRARVRRRGLEGALAMGSRSGPSKPGRPPTRGVSVSQLAESVGLTRQGLYAAAKCAGRSIEDELEHRRAMRAGKVVA